VKHKLVYPIMF